jgi:hypothetical protein
MSMTKNKKLKLSGKNFLTKSVHNRATCLRENLLRRKEQLMRKKVVKGPRQPPLIKDLYTQQDTGEPLSSHNKNC